VCRWSLPSWPHHHLDRLAIGHRAVALGYAVKADRQVEHAPWVDLPVEDVGQQLLDVAPDGGRTAAELDILVEEWLRLGIDA